MKKTIILILVVLSNTLCAQSLFKAIPRPKVGLYSAVLSPPTSFKIRPCVVIATLSGDDAIVGIGAGLQNITYIPSTERWYCNYSVNVALFPKGVGLFVGVLNNTIMLGAYLGKGKIEVVPSTGINFNN